jgi:membrane-bound lytic murein transglycosylase B
MWRASLLAIAITIALATAPAHAVPIEEHPELREFIDTMVTRHGFERKVLERWFTDAQLRPNFVAAMDRPREALPWFEYRKGFVTDERIRWGVAYWDQNRAALERAEREYGVPPEIILAIIGVETAYGRNKGQSNSLDALLTFSFSYPRRAPFFRRELEEFLLLTRELKTEPSRIAGSYAGALGIPQFMPSSYRAYAIDFDNDGRRDLFNSNADAIGSVANFLRQHGWSPGQPVADPTVPDGPLYTWLAELGVKPLMPLKQWINYGIVPLRATPLVPDTDNDRMAALLLMRGETGPMYYLGYDNFYTITRYNRSQNYAMAVYDLGRGIRARRQGENENLQSKRTP